MTDSILRSYFNYSHTTTIPFPVAPAQEGADGMIQYETDGLAFDATTYDEITSEPEYVGAVLGGTFSVKDTVTPANNLSNVSIGMGGQAIGNASGTPKMVHWPTAPYLRLVPHNHALQSQTFSDAAWTATAITVTADDTTAPDSTTTADKMVETNTTTSLLASTSNITVLANIIYTATVYVKSSNIQWFNMECISGANFAGKYFDLTNITTGSTSSSGATVVFTSASIEDVGNSWRRCHLTVALTSPITLMMRFRSASADASTTRATSAAYWLWGAQLNRGTSATAYWRTTTAGRTAPGFSWDSVNEMWGILVEAGSGIVSNRSEDLSGTSWTNSNTTESVNATTAPDGNTTADKLVEASDVGQVHSITNALTSVTSGSLYFFSCYLKAAERTWARLSLGTTRFPDDVYCDFNLSSGVSGTVGAGAAYSGIREIGGGWYRCWVGATADVTGAESATITIGEGDTDITYNGDGTSGIYAWGMQMETSTVAFNEPTSYVPQAAAAYVRSQDILEVSVTKFNFSATADTFFYYGMSKAVKTSHLMNANDGTTANRMYLHAPSGVVRSSMTATSAQGDGLTGVTPAAGALFKAAAGFEANNIVAVCNGTTSTPDFVSTMPSGITVLTIANDESSGGSGTTVPMGFVYKIMHLPRRMTTADMQSLTA